MDYENDIRIDDQMLDVEWLEQPEKMMKYCTLAAEARRDLDLAKEKVEFVRATLDSNIRKEPSKFGIEKITEGAIGNIILLQKEYIDANNVLMQAKYEADLASSAVRSFEQRKDALENLVRLHGQSYFAGPRVPHDDLSALRALKASKITPKLKSFTRTKNK